MSAVIRYSLEVQVKKQAAPPIEFVLIPRLHAVFTS